MVLHAMEAAGTIVELPDWNAYKQFVGGLSDNWVFRGQADAAWGLQTAIERTDFIGYHKDIEAGFVAEFQRGASNYLSRDQLPGHLIEWLALMQHHGAPTRLLDFTKSPFIAAYFAFEIAVPEQTVAIWALNIPFLKAKALEKLAQVYPDAVQRPANHIPEPVFERVFFDNNTSLVFPVEPFRMNRRYSLQQSIFVSTGKGGEPFMDQLTFLGTDMQRAVIKIELPGTLQKPVLRDLHKMNINRASLFPDIDGYAESLRLRYYMMRDPQEMLAEQLQALEKGSQQFLP
jgi:hypothetical protein